MCHIVNASTSETLFGGKNSKKKNFGANELSSLFMFPLEYFCNQMLLKV